MADVTIKVTGIPVDPMGVTISYGVNMIPVCMIQVNPVNSPLIQSSDTYKKNRTKVSVVAKVQNQSLSFEGYYDGLSINYSYGSVVYNAVIKSNQQLLLESNAQIPGLSAGGLNPFTRSGFMGKEISGDNGDVEKIENLVLGKIKVDVGDIPLIKLYSDILIAVLDAQTNDAYIQEFQPKDQESQDVTMLYDFFKNADFKAKTKQALAILQQDFDMTATDKINPKLGNATRQDILISLIESFLKGPNSVWESMVSYYSGLGCCLLCSKKKIFLLPDNGFITPKSSGYSLHKRGIVNEALPADYSSFSVNDNGYKNIGYVAIVQDLSNALNFFGNQQYFKGGYPKKGQQSDSPQGAVAILSNHPFIYLSGEVGRNSTGSGKVAKSYGERTSNVPGGKQQFDGIKTDEEGVEKAYDEDYYTFLRDVVDNYAETKYFQIRYGDRTGDILMDFNNNWVPATSGVLYSKQIEQKLFFMVQSVTHNISISASNSGSASTSINFNSCRSGQAPLSIDTDKLYNYNQGDMISVQSKFLADIK